MSERNSFRRGDSTTERGFSLTELLIAMVVFTIIIGSVVTLLGKSQSIFRTEQGVSEMDQNARLMMDFLTRDIQQSRENALGLGSRFRSIYSYNGPEGKTDEMTIISADTETRIPSAALPLVSASTEKFNVNNGSAEVVPNGAAFTEPRDILPFIESGEEFILSATRQDGSIQFDFVQVAGASITERGTIALKFNVIEHRGVASEVAFGSDYEDGTFSLRPVTIKRYFIDRKTDPEHPTFSLAVNDGDPLVIARNVVAFQLRYLEQARGELDGIWVKEQNISRDYKTLAVEVTLTARTEIEGDREAERLITLASVVRPRYVPDGDFGSGGGGGRSPDDPGEGTPGYGDGGDGGGDYPGDGYGDDTGSGSGSGSGNRAGSGSGTGAGNDPWQRRTRRIGRPPKLGERLNPRP
ncbi:MAG: prepilin-type N-terminal cleavage/methylation domain-containing protein [Acidobacteriota bacterium]